MNIFFAYNGERVTERVIPGSTEGHCKRNTRPPTLVPVNDKKVDDSKILNVMAERRKIKARVTK